MYVLRFLIDVVIHCRYPPEPQILFYIVTSAWSEANSFRPCFVFHEIETQWQISGERARNTRFLLHPIVLGSYIVLGGGYKLTIHMSFAYNKLGRKNEKISTVIVGFIIRVR